VAPNPRVSELADSVPPRAIGLAHAATASVRPGLGLLASWRPGAVTLRRWRTRDWLAATVVLGALAGAALWRAGVFDTESDRRTQALRALGIDAGKHLPAGPWLEQPGHDVRGIDAAALHDLLGKLQRAGAVAVFALRIQPNKNGGETAAGLLIELPVQPTARRTILWHAAHARGLEPPLIPDPGGAYYALELGK
jgi:hypothetical protein